MHIAYIDAGEYFSGSRLLRAMPVGIPAADISAIFKFGKVITRVFPAGTAAFAAAAAKSLISPGLVFYFFIIRLVVHDISFWFIIIAHPPLK